MADSIKTWQHVCAAEQCLIAVGLGEPCNWCDGRQPPKPFTPLIAPAPRPVSEPA